MEFENDILQEIPTEKLLQLRDIYKLNWPYHIYKYYFIDLSYIWITKYNYKLKFYCPEGKWDDGSFICINENNAKIRLQFFSLDSSNFRLYHALKHTKRIKWSENKISIDILHKDQFDLYFNLTREKNFIVSYITTATYWWLPKEDAIKFNVEVPDGTYLGTLTEKHAQKVFNVWPHRNAGEITYIQNLLRYNGGVGLFNKQDDDLMAWITRNDYGALGILQTDEKYQRKGYGTFVTKVLCKQFAENNIDPVAFIVTTNDVSEKFFKRLGFQMISYMAWTICRPL